MDNIRDMEWAKEMIDAFPPVCHSMTLNEAVLFMSLKDRLYGIVAAYNYGFKRGCAYMERKRKK